MNQRIQELVKQAGTDCSGKWMGMHHAEKFAELIMQECAQACINMGDDYEIKSAGQYQAELFAFAIKKHFGVES
jgi:hypothetical protein